MRMTKGCVKTPSLIKNAGQIFIPFKQNQDTKRFDYNLTVSNWEIKLGNKRPLNLEDKGTMISNVGSRTG